MGSERENFVDSYTHSLRKTLKFYPNVIQQVEKELQQLYVNVNVNPNELNIIGIHNRRGDHIGWWRHYLKSAFTSISVSDTKYQDLGKEYFIKAMKYFRYASDANCI